MKLYLRAHVLLLEEVRAWSPPPEPLILKPTNTPLPVLELIADDLSPVAPELTPFRMNNADDMFTTLLPSDVNPVGAVNVTGVVPDATKSISSELFCVRVIPGDETGEAVVPLTVPDTLN